MHRLSRCWGSGWGRDPWGKRACGKAAACACRLAPAALRLRDCVSSPGAFFPPTHPPRSDLADLSALLEAQPFFEDFLAFLATLYAKVVGQVGWDPKPTDGHVDAMLRMLVLKVAGSIKGECPCGVRGHARARCA